MSTLTTVLDGGQDVCGDAEPTDLIRNMSNTVEAETQTDPTPFACTHPVMRCVEVAMDNVDFAATMHHDHPYCTADPVNIRAVPEIMLRGGWTIGTCLSCGGVFC